MSDQVTDIIAVVRSRANTENKCTPADYGRLCREELPHCTGKVPAVPLLVQPVMFYHHCHNGDGEADLALDQTLVVTNVMETAMPDSTPSSRAEVAAILEKLLAWVEQGIEPTKIFASLANDEDMDDICEEEELKPEQLV